MDDPVKDNLDLLFDSDPTLHTRVSDALVELVGQYGAVTTVVQIHPYLWKKVADVEEETVLGVEFGDVPSVQHPLGETVFVRSSDMPVSQLVLLEPKNPPRETPSVTVDLSA